jgi:hypothetical protein
MKTLGASTTIGLLIALLIIYLLRPLNTGAITLICLLCIGVAGALGTVLTKLFSPKAANAPKGGQQND